MKSLGAARTFTAHQTVATNARGVGRRLIAISAVVVLIGVSTADAHSQETPPSGWQVRIAPYLWLSNISGTNTIDQIAIAVADSALQANWTARVEVGRWRVRAILEWARTSHGGVILGAGAGAVAGSYDLAVADAEITTAVEIGPLGRSPDIELLVGLRSIRQRQSITLDTPPVIEQDVSAHWEKVLLGTRYCTRLGERFWFSMRADVGGDLFWGSDFTWALDGEFGVRVVPAVDAILRYKYLEFAYDNDQVGARAYSWDEGRTQGWFLGIALQP